MLTEAMLVVHDSLFNYDALFKLVEELYADIAVLNDGDASEVEEDLRRRINNAISRATSEKFLHEQKSNTLREKTAEKRRDLDD